MDVSVIDRVSVAALVNLIENVDVIDRMDASRGVCTHYSRCDYWN